MIRDPLYFNRTQLAERLVDNLQSNILHAITLFAPRRMGKTQFLDNDITQIAKEQGFSVFYYSFMDQPNQTREHFMFALATFLAEIESPLYKKANSLTKIELFGASLEWNVDAPPPPSSVSGYISRMAKTNKPVLMLLDEAQEMAKKSDMRDLIGSLRTGLDIHRDRVKVIFTGSSPYGLKSMFNDYKAPFFNFAHQIDFPIFGKEFTDFLADIYEKRTGSSIDKEKFFSYFAALGHTPLFARTMIQEMILNPNLTLEQVFEVKLEEFTKILECATVGMPELTALEKIILQLISENHKSLYSAKTRSIIAERLGVDSVSAQTVQGQLRKLEKKELVIKNAHGDYEPAILYDF